MISYLFQEKYISIAFGKMQSSPGSIDTSSNDNKIVHD